MRPDSPGRRSPRCTRAATACSALTVLAVGRLVDRRGVGTAWAAVAVGLAAGCGVASLAAGAVGAFVALALLRAFGQGSFPLLGTLMVAARFDGWRGRALAVGNLGSTLAAAGLPAVAVLLIAELGFRDAFRVTGLAVLVLVAPLALVAARLAPRCGRGRRGDGRGSPPARERFPWREGGGVLLVILAAPPLVVTGAVFHATSILAERGLGDGAAAGVLAVLAVTTALGAVVAGVLLDRAGARPVLVASSLLLGGGVGAAARRPGRSPPTARSPAGRCGRAERHRQRGGVGAALRGRAARCAAERGRRLAHRRRRARAAPARRGVLGGRRLRRGPALARRALAGLRRAWPPGPTDLAPRGGLDLAART